MGPLHERSGELLPGWMRQAAHIAATGPLHERSGELKAFSAMRSNTLLQWGRCMNAAESPKTLRAASATATPLQWGRCMNAAESRTDKRTVMHPCSRLQWGRCMNAAESPG